jgi:biotin carboxyl carrier protein
VIYEVSRKKSKDEPVRVELRELDEGKYEIEIDGRTLSVDAVKSGRTIYSVIENDRQYEVSVDETSAREFDVLVRGRLFHLEAVDERSRLLAQTAKVAASGPQTVEAEMPGKVVLVKAAVGDALVEGQGVVVVEAMKMENEISSPIDGVLKELGVEPGDTVEVGDVLFVVEPPRDAEA